MIPMKSMSEKEVMKSFLRHKKRLLKQLGSRALYNTQLDQKAALLFGPRYLGTHSQDTAILNRSGFQIINVDTTNQPGTHWVALYSTPKTIYVYDSFGRPTSRLLKHLTKAAKNRKLSIVDSDKDPEQFGNSQICGVLCLSWLLCVKELGIKNAMKI